MNIYDLVEHMEPINMLLLWLLPIARGGFNFIFFADVIVGVAGAILFASQKKYVLLFK